MRYKKKSRRKRWAGTVPLIIFTAACIYIMESAGITKNTIMDTLVKSMQANLGYQAVKNCIPILTYDTAQSGQKTLYDYLADSMDELLPIYGYTRRQEIQIASGLSGLPEEAEDSCGSNMDTFDLLNVIEDHQMINENQLTQQDEIDLQGIQETDNTGADRTQDAASASGTGLSTAAAGEKVKKYSREKLNDFDYLLQNFYRVDSTTTTNSRQLNATELLAKDMSVDQRQDGPQILIYHTHSQERFADSTDASQSVVGLGDYLTKLLEDTYGYKVLHHKGEYDIPDRDNAYSKAAPVLERLLKENPSIQVVIDLHRDGVAEGTRLVEKINGKDTATIMFFNGLSHTTAQGDISYLANPNLSDNLAFSLQLQLAAAEYYPGFSRCIYLKGYRYNLHYLPKSLLVEVGAQTNTYNEAVNAMEPLADVLDKVLSGEE